MSITVKATVDDQTIEREIGHFDVLKASYGIEDSMPLRDVIHIAVAMFVLGVLTVLAVIAPTEALRAVAYAAIFFQVGFVAARAAGTLYTLKIAEFALPRASWVPEATYFFLTITTAIGAAAVAYFSGGVLGFLAGFTISILNPFARCAGDLVIQQRARYIARQARNLERLRNANPTEGASGGGTAF